MDSSGDRVLIEYEDNLLTLFPSLFSSQSSIRTYFALYSIKPKDANAYLEWTPHYATSDTNASIDSDFFWNPVRQAWECAVVTGNYGTSLPPGITWIKKPSRMLYRGFIDIVAYHLPDYNTSSSTWSKPMTDAKIQPTNSVVRQFASPRPLSSNDIDLSNQLVLFIGKPGTTLANYVDVTKFAALSSQEQLYTYLTLRFQEDGTMWSTVTAMMLTRFRMGTTISSDKLLDSVIDSK